MAVVVPVIMLSIVGVLAVTARRRSPRLLVGGLLGVDALGVIAAAAVLLWSAPGFAQAAAQPAKAAAARGGMVGTDVGAALAVGLACIGAGIGVGIAGAAAIGAVSQRSEMLGRSLVFVGLAEGIAIYGLVIAFLILLGIFGGG